MEKIEGQLNQTRSVLKQREDEVLSLILRMSKLDYSHQHQPIRMREIEGQLNQTRYDLELKQDEVLSLVWSMGEIEGRLNSIRSGQKLNEDEALSLILSMGEIEGHLYSIRSDLERREEEMKSLQQRVTEMEHSNQQQHQDPRMREMEEELNQTRSALDAKDKELKSIQERVAADVSLSMKTGRRLESKNSQISRSRLEDMYEELRSQWPKIKTDLKSNEETPETVKRRIQETFNKAKLAMEMKKTQIDKVFGLNEASRGSASEKVQQCWQSTCQNLQLVLYHGRTEDADLKTPSSSCEGGKPQDVMEFLSSRCYWLGCLMALNNPPLQPDWENHHPGMDKWNFFPQKLTDASGK